MKCIKSILGFVCQYVKEVIATMFSIFTWIDVDNIFISIVIASIVWCIVYFLCSMVYIVLDCFRKPKECKILHLSKNTIHMKPKYYKDKKQFIYDFDIILKYAQNKGYTYLDASTHIVILDSLLRKYIDGDSKIVRHKCNNMIVGASVEVATSIGKFIIKRIPDGMNTCARYEYSRFMNFNKFIRTLRNVKRYHITIKFKYE